jgi:hypothetical protein
MCLPRGPFDVFDHKLQESLQSSKSTQVNAAKDDPSLETDVLTVRHTVGNP